MDRRKFFQQSGAAFAAAAVTNPLRVLAERSESRSIPGYSVKGSATAKPLATASNDLSSYTGTWGDREIMHLLRRAMMGVPYTQFQAAKAMAGMSAVVDKLVEVRPLPGKPGAWVDSLYIPDRTITDPVEKQKDFQNKQRLNRALIASYSDWWMDLVLKEDLSIREKMTLMWSNHFVTGWDVVNQIAYVHTYLDMLHRNSLGNIKTFTYEMSINPAMLVYLNGAQSNYRIQNGKTINNINENFARELMELFTLGIFDPKTGENNYTETDIQEAAKALSGWMPTQTAPFEGKLNPQLHYPDNITFFGDTGKFGLQDILDRIFAKKGGYNAAFFICKKIYETFVYYVANAEVVDKMAELLVASNWEIVPVMKALLESAHFYDSEVMGAQLKSPVELVGSVIREFNLMIPPYNAGDPPIVATEPYNTYKDLNPTHSYLVQYAGFSLGQEVLNPPNVAGWPGGRIWINTGTLPLRKSIPATALMYPNFFNGTGGRKGAKITFEPLGWISMIPNVEDMKPAEVVNAVTDFVLAFDLGPTETKTLQDILNFNKLPDDQFYLDNGYVAQMAQGIVTLPEFQLV